MKIIRIPDCGECIHIESLQPPFSASGKYMIYCSNPAVDNETIWEAPTKDFKYPNFKIPHWCPLEDLKE